MTVRTDAGKELGSVGRSYTVLQNRDGFRPLEPIVEEGVVRLETGGVLRSPRLREIVAAVDPEAIVDQAISLEKVFKASGRLLQSMFMLEVVLAAVAFVLAVSGLYALMSFTVSQRTREVAIRSALGARPANIVATIARRAALQLGIGLALGGVWAWVMLRQFVDHPMFLPINMPVTIVVTLVVTAMVGVVGCASPTIRGLRIQPSEAMRES